MIYNRLTSLQSYRKYPSFYKSFAILERYKDPHDLYVFTQSEVETGRRVIPFLHSPSESMSLLSWVTQSESAKSNKLHNIRHSSDVCDLIVYNLVTRMTFMFQSKDVEKPVS